MKPRHKIKQMIIGTLGSDAFGTNSKIKDPLEGLNIQEEYNRIQNKESKLSARLRQMVELRFIHQSKLAAEKEDNKNQ